MAKPPSKCRSWCVTQKGWDEELVAKFNALVPSVNRMVVGREKGESGYEHLQVYVRFKEPVRFSWWKNQFPTAHVEVFGWKNGKPIPSTEAQAAAYCAKEGDVVINVGVDKDEVIEKGSMTKDEEALQVIAEINSGVRFGQIRQRHPLFIFWNRRFIMDYYRDHSWFRDYPEQDPTM